MATRLSKAEKAELLQMTDGELALLQKVQAGISLRTSTRPDVNSTEQLLQNEHSTDVDSTSRVRASASALTSNEGVFRY